MLSRGSTSAGAVGSSKAEWAVKRALSGAEREVVEDALDIREAVDEVTGERHGSCL
jgi:hypothetical protein